MIIDLHIHSHFSDGELSPKEIIDEASKNGVSVISITDHDTIEAYSEDLYNYAKEKNIKIINGVEISTKIGNLGIHILGYNIDINNKKLIKNLSLSRNARHNYLINVGKKLTELGYILNIEKLEKIESVTKAHIALDIINNEKNNDQFLKTFKHIPNRGEFIETIMNEGCPAYVRKESITPKEASKLIKNVSGKVVLAHPVAYKFEDNLEVEDVLNLINEIKPDGIETYYIYINRNNNKINEIDKWNKIAKERNLLITIGSDFHTKDNIHPLIGLINEDLKLSDNIIEK